MYIFRKRFERVYNRNVLVICNVIVYYVSTFLGIKKKQKVNIPAGYTKVFSDNFTQFDNSIKRLKESNDYIIGNDWGEFHHNNGNPSCYFDTTWNTTKLEFDTLKLKVITKPKKYNESDVPEHLRHEKMRFPLTIHNKVPFIKTKKGYKHGLFKADIKLPVGLNLWPAFWLSGLTKWPPEIDILEAYTDINDKYGYKNNRLLNKDWKLQPNIHYGTKDEHKYYGAHNSPVFDAHNRFVEYACHWTKDFIKIYYDGRLIFHVWDKDVLKYFNEDDSHMQLIFNISLTKNAEKITMSEMEIKNINIYQKFLDINIL